jgi:tetratricopeptide (TPR) repeat protein
MKPPLLTGATWLTLLALLAYYPIYGGDFLWDDYLWLWDNSIATSPNGWFKCWIPGNTTDYYPVTSMSFWLQWHLFGRESTGYQIINVLLLALGSIIIWRILIALGMNQLWAWFAALLFILHPINVASAGWISEQKNTLSMVFYAAAMLAWLKHEDQPSSRVYLIILILFILGLLSKASGVLLPAMMLLTIWWQKNRIREQDVMRTIPIFAIALAFCAITIHFQQNFAIAGQQVRPEGFASRLAVAGHAVWFYLGKALWPADLILVYPRWQIEGSSFNSFIPLLALIFCAAALWRFRAGPARPVLLALIIFVLALAPILGFFTMFYHSYSLVADQWAYLALPAIAALVALAAQRIAHGRSALAVALMLLLACPLAALTIHRTRIFHHKISLWSDTIQRNPTSVVAHLNLGTAYERKGNLNQAAHYFKEAITLDRNYGKAYSNLGAVYAKQDRLGEATAHFRTALQIDKQDHSAHKNLGMALLKLGQIKQGAASLRRGQDIRYDKQTQNILSQLEQR